MSRQDDRVLKIFLGVFIFLLLIFCGLTAMTLSKMEETQSARKKSRNKLIGEIKAVKLTQRTIQEVSNVTGYYSPFYIQKVSDFLNNPNADPVVQTWQEGVVLRTSLNTLFQEIDLVANNDETIPGTKAYLKIKSTSDNNTDAVIRDYKIPRDKEGNITDDFKIALASEGSDLKKKVVTLEEIWNGYTKQIVHLQKGVKKKSGELLTLTSGYNKQITDHKKTQQENYEKIASIRKKIETVRKGKEQKLSNIENARNIAQKEKGNQRDQASTKIRQQLKLREDNSVELEKLDKRINELLVEAAGRKDSLDNMFQRINELDKDITTNLEKKAKEVVAETSKRLSEIQKSKTKGQEAPDGEIIHVNSKLKVAYINLGRSEGAFPGLRFDVFRYGKGGEKISKGKVEIRRVKGNMSMVGILKTTDKLDPISRGDKIINRVYDRNKITHFVVAGTLVQKYSWTQASRQLKKLGGKLEQNITARTDFVVLAEGYKDDNNYEESKRLGIETMLESVFVDYLDD